MKSSWASERDVASACRRQLCASTKEVVSRIARQCDYAVILSGGVDTAAIVSILAHDAHVKKPSVLVTCNVAKGEDHERNEEARDLAYAEQVAKTFLPEVPHLALVIRKEQLVMESQLCVRALKSFDGMSIRNAVIPYMAMKATIEKYPFVRAFVTGDGADELLGGYSFFWDYENEKFMEERAKMCSDWFFSTPVLAESLGCSAVSPYTSGMFKDWALSQTCKPDCVGTADIVISLGDEPRLHKTGKLCLRLGIETPSSWRRKEPIQLGSGSAQMEMTEFWEKSQWSSEKDFLRDVFKNTFPLPCPFTGRGTCTFCGYRLTSKDSQYCRTCGAWPAQPP